MNSKRPASAANIGSVKRSKTQHEDGPVLTGTDDSVQTGNINSRLRTLENLAREVMGSPGASEVDPEVMKAVTILSNNCNRREKLSRSVSRDNSEPRQTPETHHSAHASNKNGNSPIPPLPPIRDTSLEKAVFTHPGVGNNNKTTYDRLEILGDAYIELIATRMVWERFTDISSGRISQIRELLVKNETLSNFASIYGFDRKASVPSDHVSQSKRWTKTKGDIFEAYVAAVILSDPTHGYQTAVEWLSHLWVPMLSGLEHQQTELRSKEALAKKIMGKGIRLEYMGERPTIQQKGGTQTHFIGVYLTGWGWTKRHLGSGKGLSKAAAGDQAAQQALQNTPLILEIMEAKRSWELQET
ncbi:hypothetical protein N7510_003550 [Penicillium lagena]|uniref:uncharacterized protein n=1 Tax=Penicillium lagena TaxID=94218 RepID=UPI0025422CD0|nr:uncharacterized protein N7510_003550 [Penicillium lagena]KAJ5619566.1 hypothetical protein N7510_003550 [Penicillium lagena]